MLVNRPNKDLKELPCLPEAVLLANQGLSVDRPNNERIEQYHRLGSANCIGYLDAMVIWALSHLFNSRPFSQSIKGYQIFMAFDQKGI